MFYSSTGIKAFFNCLCFVYIELKMSTYPYILKISLFKNVHWSTFYCVYKTANSFYSICGTATDTADKSFVKKLKRVMLN